MRTREEVRASKKAIDAAYHHAHKEGRNARSAAWRADHKEADRARNAAYYAAHTEEKGAYMAAYSASHREEKRQEQAEFREWLQILRTVNGCADEGPHNGRLEHHHIDPSTKLYNISQMYNRSLDALEDELEKCVVLCDAGHKNRHVELRLAESRAVW